MSVVSLTGRPLYPWRGLCVGPTYFEKPSLLPLPEIEARFLGRPFLCRDCITPVHGSRFVYVINWGDTGGERTGSRQHIQM